MKESPVHHLMALQRSPEAKVKECPVKMNWMRQDTRGKHVAQITVKLARKD